MPDIMDVLEAITPADALAAAVGVLGGRVSAARTPYALSALLGYNLVLLTCVRRLTREQILAAHAEDSLVERFGTEVDDELQPFIRRLLEDAILPDAGYAPGTTEDGIGSEVFEPFGALQVELAFGAAHAMFASAFAPYGNGALADNRGVAP